MKKQKKQIVNCPVCGTPCIVEGTDDFGEKDKVNTLHYQSLWEDTNRELQAAKNHINRLENIIKARLKYCQEQNGLPYCKNCGLSEEDLE